MTEGRPGMLPLTARDIIQRGRANGESLRRSRQRIAEALAATAGGIDGLSDRERSQMTTILRRLADEVQTTILGHLERWLADKPRAARALGERLGGAGREDAYAQLVDAGLLRDADVIEKLQERLLEDRLERAMRRQDTGAAREVEGEGLSHGEALFALLQSAGPAVVEGLNQYLVRRAHRVDAYDNPTVDLGELNPALVGRLHWGLAAAIRRMILADRTVDETDLDNALEAATVEALEDIRDRPGPEASCRRFTEAAAEAGLLSPDLIVALLRAGEVPLFEAALARWAGIRIGLVRRLVFEPGGEGLAAVAKAAGMSIGHFSVLAKLTRLARYPSVSAAHSELSAVEAIFVQLPPAEASRVLAYWKRHPDYLSAL
ncbi:MAG: DUF2336 domain-containing protein, partial [Rhodospirillaceae bacterium]